MRSSCEIHGDSEFVVLAEGIIMCQACKDAAIQAYLTQHPEVTRYLNLAAEKAMQPRGTSLSYKVDLTLRCSVPGCPWPEGSPSGRRCEHLNPNRGPVLQNIPVRTELGQQIRAASASKEST